MKYKLMSTMEWMPAVKNDDNTIRHFINEETHEKYYKYDGEVSGTSS